MASGSLPPENGALEGLQSIGLLPRQDAVIGGLAPDMPASRAGLQVGDLVLAINGRQVDSWYDLKGIIQEVGACPVEILILREGK